MLAQRRVTAFEHWRSNPSDVAPITSPAFGRVGSVRGVGRGLLRLKPNACVGGREKFAHSELSSCIRQPQRARVALMLGTSEGKVTSPRVSSADSRRGRPLYCVAAAVPRPPSGRPAGSSETRRVTRRVSGTLDLAATFRLPAGGDIAPQFGGGSSRSSSPCTSQIPSRCRGGRKAGRSGRDGYDVPACSDGSFSWG